MKFTDGFWLLRDGVRQFAAAEAYAIEAGKDSLRVLAPTRRISSRGDTLNGATLTVDLSSPARDVIRVKLTHFAGARAKGPEFGITGDPDARAEIRDDGKTATLSSGRLSVRVVRGEGWNMDFLADGRVLTSSGPKGMAYVETAESSPGSGYAKEELSLGVGESVYGLGERFSAFVKNGQSVDIWNRDGGTASEQTYKNIPFYLTNRGYGVFVNDPGLVSFEVASEKLSRVQFSVAGQSLEYFLIYGPTPKEILRKYTALTGLPSLPPAWSFGLWLTTSFTTSYDEKTVTGFIQGMADRDLPLAVFHFDCFWMREYAWCDFKWDPRTFPDPEGMLKRLKARGLRICLWINPYIAQASSMFAEGMAGGFLARKPNGDVWQTDLWQAGMGIVDFTNPGARKWFGDKLRSLVDMGADCFKTDFGERIPTDVAWFDGSDPGRMHNYYTYLYNQTVFEVLREKKGADAVLFARSATAGSQRYPIHWGGDSESTFESMAESLRGGLSLGLSGFGFWSHDIGGFEGTPRPEVYKRWLAFGLLSSHSRLHGSSSYRVPWLFDDEAVDVLRLFTKLKCRLMPYLYAAAVEASSVGIPVMRAMILEFPDDLSSATLDRQYMLGSSLLVAPVFSAEGSVEYWLPSGKWTRYLTGEAVEGGRWMRETHGFSSLPLLVRPGSVIATGAVDSRPDYDFADGVTLEAFAPIDGETVTTAVTDLTGAESAVFETRREGGILTVTRRIGSKPWRFLLVGAEEASGVTGGSPERSERGTLIAASSESLTITLR
jgi:alpha-D-xyloside xylohydrolase